MTLALAFTAVLAGCGVDAPPDEPAAEECTDDPCPPVDPCATEVHTLAQNEFGQLFVPVDVDGEPSWLLLDTGSSLSFLFLGADGPDFIPSAGSVGLGCEELELAGRGFDPFITEIEGQPVVGLLGVDVLVAQPTLLDLAAPSLTRSEDAPDVTGALRLPFDDVQGHVIVPVSLDDVPVRLMLDTAAPNTVWLGQQGQPGDDVVQVADAEGNVLSFYLGTAALVLPGEPVRTIAVERAPSWPYFEETVAILGGNIHGLLGKSALDGRAVLFGVEPDALFLTAR